MPAQNESIVAIATGGGSSALGVIRVSGTQALPIVSKIFHPVKPGLSLEKLKGYNLLFGKILDKQELIDEVLVSVFRAPKSFTGEDLVEISCHGSPFILQRVLQLCLKNGARLASPGEFTLRAYLNKKMDLSQAEAVADLISAKNEAAHKLAMRQMKGSISNEIGTLREELLQLSSLLELELDFSEEDVEFADRSQLKNLAEELVARCGKLLQSFRLGNALKKGIPVAIVGAPNAGKSTLLNTLLKENRALVSDIAGTTRDTIEEELSMDGIGFRIIDTAGIRETTDQVETLGIERTFLKLGEAQFILWIVDVSSPMNEDEFKKIHTRLMDAKAHDQKLLVIANKTDAIKGSLPDFMKLDAKISAKKAEGISSLERMLVDEVKALGYDSNVTLISSARHEDALSKAKDSLEQLLQGMEIGIPTDLLAQDLRQANYFLGEILGQISNDEILGSIFSKFCIGK